MLQAMIIGYLGADAQCQSKDGRNFTTFRVSHSDKWTSQDGVAHETTIWCDVILNDHPAVVQYLKAGTLVCVRGAVSLRVYSSAKDRCYKAGLTIRADQLELLGGKRDAVPSRLFDTDGVQHNVTKYYHTERTGCVLMDKQAQQYVVDDNGWVLPIDQAPQEVQNAVKDQSTK